MNSNDITYETLIDETFEQNLNLSVMMKLMAMIRNDKQKIIESFFFFLMSHSDIIFVHLFGIFCSSFFVLYWCIDLLHRFHISNAFIIGHSITKGDR